MYESLMKEADLELDESNHVPHAPINLQLAQKHYRSRFLELQELILAEESKFKTVFKEIEDIRAGLWDKDVQQRNSSELPIELPQELRGSSSPEKPADDLFSGSDLSGVTESSESNHSPSQTKEDLIAPIVPPEQVQVQEEALSMGIEEGPTQNPLSLPPIPRPTTESASDEISEDTEKVPEIEELIEEDRCVAIDLQSETASQPSIIITENEASEANDVKQLEKEAQMEDVRVSETSLGWEKEVAERTDEHADQRQEEEEEEEEEEVSKEEESKEEEEEASQEQNEDSQGQEAELEGKEEEMPSQEDVLMDMEQNAKEREPSPPKYVPQIDLETESEPVHTPTADTTSSEPEPIADDGETSETGEPVAPTRRSTRRRKSSAASIPPPQTRTRLRSQARISETEPQVVADSENDGDAEEVKEETPVVEDEQVSSPFDGAITRQRDGKRKASFLESAGSPQDKKRLREDSEPVDEEEPGPSSHNMRTRITRHATRTEEQVALKRFQNVIGMLHSQISQHRYGNIFHNPIKNSEAPDYHDIVKRPMDLKTIKTRVKDGVIANSLEYQRDIYLMFANAMMYNRPSSDVHAMAEDMMLESEGQITAFRQTEGLVKRGQRP